MKIFLGTALAAMAMATIAPAPSQAATLFNISSIGLDSPGGKNGTISYAPTSFSVNAGIGRLALNGTDAASDPVSFLTYCIDIFHFVHAGPFTLQAASSILSNPTKLGQLSALLANADPLVVDATTSAAAQLAVWEIAFETGTSAYDLNAGDLKVTGGNSAGARTLANSYLANVIGGTWQPSGGKLEVLYAPDNQIQLLSVAAVPEPATWAMLIGGFGLVGASMRRRRKFALALA